MSNDSPTIDDRLKALAESVQLLTADIHAMQKEQKRLDARERLARDAMLSGISAYLQALKDGEDEDQND